MFRVTVPEGVGYKDLSNTYGIPEALLRQVNPHSGELTKGQSINIPIQEQWLEGTGYHYVDDAVLQMEKEQLADLRIDRQFPLEREEYVTPRTSEEIMTKDQQDASTDFLPSHTKFMEKIRKIETGGLDNPFIRTRAAGGQGSAAFGPYQVTPTLTQDYLERRKDIFTPEEAEALEELRARQEAALIIGGRDRVAFERGGPRRQEGVALAKQFGYEDVDEFLQDFDYGGNLGVNQNMGLITSAQEKMLMDTYEQAGRDEVEAAARWHGGPNWRKDSQNFAKTQQYLEKFGQL